MVARAAENYSEADRARTEARTRQWGKVTTATRTDARLAVLRQQRRRQIAAVKPTKAASSLDPWELAIEAIARCKRIWQSAPTFRTELEGIAETCRRLAWGPEDGDEWLPKARPSKHRQIPGQLALFDEDGVAVAA